MDQSILDMAGGSIRRRVDLAMAEVIRNCMDWSTDAQKDRKPILTEDDGVATIVENTPDIPGQMGFDEPKPLMRMESA